MRHTGRVPSDVPQRGFTINADLRSALLQHAAAKAPGAPGQLAREAFRRFLAAPEPLAGVLAGPTGRLRLRMPDGEHDALVTHAAGEATSVRLVVEGALLRFLPPELTLQLRTPTRSWSLGHRPKV